MAKPLSDEEIRVKQISIDKYDKSDFKYAFNHFMTPILDDYRRFLDTIADLKQHIELDTAIKKDHRIKMTADRKELEKYRQGWLVKENKKLRERIEELKTTACEYIDKYTKAKQDAIKKSITIADQTATIERLLGEIGEMLKMSRLSDKTLQGAGPPTAKEKQE